MTRPEAIRLAHEMHGTGGWGFIEIHRYLAEHGIDVHPTTVRRWADPEYAAARQQKQRAYQRQWKRARRGAAVPRVADADALKRRAAALARAGLDARGIGIVLSVDFGVRATTHAVRHLLATGELSASLRSEVQR